MTTKINLTIEEDLIKDVKRYARERKTSVSKVVQDQLRALLNKKEKNKKSFVEKYAGIIKDIRIDDIDKVRDEYLKEKYGL